MENSIRKTIIKNSTLSILIVSIMFSIYFLCSIYNQQMLIKNEKNELLLFEIKNKIELTLKNYLNLAEQIESRTMIKTNLKKFLDGELDYDEIISYTTPKLEDAYNKISSISGLIRITNDKTIISQLGSLQNLTLDEVILEHHEDIYSKIINKQDECFYVINSKIKLNSEIIGKDILVFSTKDLESCINAYDEIVVLECNNESNIKNSNITKENLNTKDYIYLEDEINLINCKLNLYINKSTYNKPIIKEMLKVIPILLIIAAIGIINGYIVTSPLIGKIIIKNSELAKEIDNKTIALQLANSKLKKLSITDSLTGLGTRRYFDESLKRVWESHIRSKKPMSLIMCDIDNYKQYNDLYGHLKGDECLKSISKVLLKNRRATDTITRYGGDEFIIILSECDIKNAISITQKIMDDIYALHIPHKDSKVKECISLSYGIVSVIPNNNMNYSTIVKSVDDELYKSKNKGRDTLSFKQL